MEMILIWCGGLGGALIALGAKWLMDSIEDLRLDIEELREEVIRHEQKIRTDKVDDPDDYA